ncbi:MAG TPA: Gfo/Idh/MocA family oxidoreductase [Opitutus sp.]|nr:Gfo/Idh/MocA family oxidoreductase [Opitutus sp.]
MGERLNWGIIATGTIARTFARGVARSQSGRVVAVGSRTLEAAKKFAGELGVPRAHGSYDALLADPGVRAVYIATPHPQHVEWVERAAAAGKHVLCEKPLGVTRAEAERAVAACRARGVLLMEAFMYRCHPQTAKIVELVRGGALGQVRLVQATFSFAMGFDATNRIFNKALGGGGILDVGCYPVSLARLVAGAVDGAAFADPVRVTGAVELHPQTGVDVCAAATLQFANGMIAQVATGVALWQDNSARIYGTDGWLHVPEPWIPAREGGKVVMYLHRGGKASPEKIVVRAGDWLYGLEADAFAAALAAGRRDVPQMSTADTLGNMAVLDAWAAVQDKREMGEKTVSKGDDNGLDRPLSRI